MAPPREAAHLCPVLESTEFQQARLVRQRRTKRRWQVVLPTMLGDLEPPTSGACSSIASACKPASSDACEVVGRLAEPVAEDQNHRFGQTTPKRHHAYGRRVPQERPLPGEVGRARRGRLGARAALRHAGGVHVEAVGEVEGHSSLASFSGGAKRRPENLGPNEAPAVLSSRDARVKPEHDGVWPSFRLLEQFLRVYF